MKNPKNLQIDVIGQIKDNGNVMQMRLIVDGRSCIIYMSTADYEALMYDKVFVRDGNSTDSAGVINNTNNFKEFSP